MTRRALLAALSAVVLDPEKLLWERKSLISVPSGVRVPDIALPLEGPTVGPEFFNLGDIITFGRNPERFVVIAAGPRFSDIKFRYHDPAAALIRPL